MNERSRRPDPSGSDAPPPLPSAAQAEPGQLPDDDARIDEMSEESFPASDPPASTHASATPAARAMKP